MNSTYAILEDIWKRYAAGESRNIESDVLDLLFQQGIMLRRHDGELKQVTISKPTTLENAFVIGLRHIKKDGSCTEDHFLCQRNHALGLKEVGIEAHYKKRLEQRLPEYKGTHKEQVDFGQAWLDSSATTHANTITFIRHSN